MIGSTVIFGDSLSDTGNLATLLGGNKNLDIIFPQNTCGSMSNGPTWAELFAKKTNSRYNIGFSSKKYKLCNSITNFSIIGANISSVGTSLPYQSLKFQTDAFLKKVNPCCGKKTNVIFLIGGNDIMFRVYPLIITYIITNQLSFSSITPTLLSSLIPNDILQSYENEWTKVANVTIGSEKFLVSNCPNLTNSPFYINTYSPLLQSINWTFDESIKLGIMILDTYTKLLQDKIDLWNTNNKCPFIGLLDIQNISTEINTEKSKYGILFDNKYPVWNGNFNDVPFSLNTYYNKNRCGKFAAFWDWIHPTKLVHCAIMQYILNIYINN